MIYIHVNNNLMQTEFATFFVIPNHENETVL